MSLGDYNGPGRAHALVCYMIGRRRQANDLEAFRVFVTDSLQLVPQGKYLTERYADKVRRRPNVEIDVEAIIKHVAEVGGLEVIESESA